MIEIHNLTKVYRGRGHRETVALKGLNFCLPDKGMVFIVGKSGCGKSTLLNVISGGDRFTSGEIIIDGNPMSSLSAREYDDFRCGVVGLIFQDYCLLDGLTVEENVALPLKLAGKEDDARVREAISLVELEDKVKSYPDELSGGQKQRVGIARALVKDAKYILADEPTGNLDAASAHRILTLLKEISKDRLVLIVSHCRPDADEFADRIIELSDGEIVGDRLRDRRAKELTFTQHEVVFQRGHDFTEEELSQINRRTAEGATLRQVDTRFRKTPVVESDTDRTPIPKYRMNRSGARMLFRLFAKKRIVSMVVSALCIVFLFVVLGVCQFFTKFDADAETARIMREHNGTLLAMRKGHYEKEDPSKTLDTSRLLRVTDEDIAAFREAGYEGNIFPLYGVSMITLSSGSALWSIQGYSVPPDGQNYSAFYCKTGLGVLQVTREYLTKKYGVDGELKVLSGELTSEGDRVIVTDYFADSLLTYEPTLRASATELEAGGNKYMRMTTGKMLRGRYRIAAVIDTGYTERYQPLIDLWKSGKQLTESEEESELAMQFYEELSEGLNLAYTFNPHFLEDYSVDEGRTYAYYGEGIAEIDGRVNAVGTRYCNPDKTLKDDEIRLRDSYYLEAIGAGDDIPVDLTAAVGTKIKLRLGDVFGEEPYFEREFTIKEVYTKEKNVSFLVSSEVFRELLAPSVYTYALYFDDMEGAIAAFEAGTELGFAVQSPFISAMYTVSRAASVFVELFGVMIWAMLILAAVTLANFGVGCVKKCVYEIGVVRAMGAKTKDLVLLFILQMLLVTVIVCLISMLGLWLGAGMCNSVLAEGFATVTKNAAMRGIRFINFSWTTVLSDAGLMIGLTAFCTIAPLLFLHRIKPREIIRAKE